MNHKPSIAIAFIITLLIAHATVAETPDALAPLRELLADETAAVAALDRFDTLQQGLIEWDLAMADELAQSGDAVASAQKQTDAEQRLVSVRNAYQLVLGTYPDNAIALNGFGELMYHRFNDDAAAVLHWKKAAASSKSEPLCRANLANYYGHSGNYEMMSHYLDEALAIDANHPDILFYAVQIYLIHFPQIAKAKGWSHEKVFNKAMAMSRKAADLAPTDHQLQEDYAVNFFAAENMGVKADWNEAAKAWERTRDASFTQDDTFFAWLNLARVHTMTGDWEAAERSIQEAITINPKNQSAKRIKEMIKNREPLFKENAS